MAAFRQVSRAARSLSRRRNRGVVTTFQLVVAGRHGPELLEPVEGTLDLVTVLVPDGVEVAGSAATRSLTDAAGPHILAFRDRVRMPRARSHRRLARDPYALSAVK